MKKNHQHSEMPLEQRIVGFKTVLRLRPHQKKERDDPVLIRPIPNTPNAIVLHPPKSNLLSPSSALVRQTLSPDAVKSTVDADFRFDSVLWPDTDQSRFYFAHGLPMVSSAMEPLKDMDQELMPKNHLLITMGASGSGKTFSSWGASVVTERKQDADGLLPRMLDSFFSQSKHQVFHGSITRDKYKFAVKMTLLQVNQNQTKPQECQIHDLMQAPSSSTFSISTATSAISSLSGASSLFGCSSSNSKSPIIQNLKQVEGTSASGATAMKQSLHSFGTSSISNNSHEETFVEQDSVTSDYKVINAQVQLCRSDVEAREALQVASKNRLRLANHKRYQSHVYVTMQPVLLERSSGKIACMGGTVGVLDMASYANPAVRLSKQVRGNRSKETELSSANDGHAAIMHCLSTLRGNQELLNTHSNKNQDAMTSKSSDDRTSLESQTRSNMRSFQSSPSMKKVPYRQHKLTMLIQPLFGSSAYATDVTLIVTAYTGHRDYSEKKILMDELSPFHGCSPVQVCTGLAKSNAAAIVKHPKNRLSTNKREKLRRDRKKIPIASPTDADDEGQQRSKNKAAPKVQVIRTAPIAVAPGITSFSDSEDDLSCIPLPPPLAPSYAAAVGSPEPSAPMENDYASIGTSLLPPLYVSHDFSGTRMNQVTSPQQSMSEHSATNYLGFGSPTHALNGDIHTIRKHINGDVSMQDEAIHANESYKFSPMKTLNDMVYASKKKGKQVMEKISYPLPLTIKIVDNSYDKPSRQVVVENQKLAAVNESLLEKNDRLQKENEALRAALMQNVRSRNESPQHERPLTGSLTRQGSSRTSLSADGGLLDNELLRFMTQVQGNSQYY